MKILVISNNDVGLYRFRAELLELLCVKNDVIVSLPDGPYIPEIKKLGCSVIVTSVDRRGINPFKDLILFFRYISIIAANKPETILSYTIKPNIYGGIASQVFNVPLIANVTGLGTALENQGVLQKVVTYLYRFALRRAKRIFCQNQENLVFFKKHITSESKLSLLPGSGVNLSKFSLLPYPTEDTVEFAFISRIMKEKGIENYLNIANRIKGKYSNVVFHVCGFCEQNYEPLLQQMVAEGIIEYHGMVKDTQRILRRVHCVIHPSYYPEGISNTLLESAACGRAIITTDRSGCREVVDHEVNGYIVPVRDEESLMLAVEKFIHLQWKKKEQMGLEGRKMVEEKFDRKIIIDSYVNEIFDIRVQRQNENEVL